MVRKLKHHEQKLLRKVDLISYKSDGPSHREHSIIRRYHLTHPLDYSKSISLTSNREVFGQETLISESRA
jgi:U3 small nucleolar ribonucleoprotein protein IMP3